MKIRISRQIQIQRQIQRKNRLLPVGTQRNIITRHYKYKYKYHDKYEDIYEDKYKTNTNRPQLRLMFGMVKIKAMPRKKGINNYSYWGPLHNDIGLLKHNKYHILDFSTIFWEQILIQRIVHLGPFYNESTFKVKTLIVKCWVVFKWDIHRKPHCQMIRLRLFLLQLWRTFPNLSELYSFPFFPPIAVLIFSLSFLARNKCHRVPECAQKRGRITVQAMPKLTHIFVCKVN